LGLLDLAHPDVEDLLAALHVNVKGDKRHAINAVLERRLRGSIKRG